MKWIKKGLIYNSDGKYLWAKTHAMIPTPILLNNSIIRIYLTFCDECGIGRAGYIDVDSFNPKNILSISPTPILGIGKAGTFDENGVAPCSIVEVNHKRYMYYVGFEQGTKIRYRLLSGLAISNTHNKKNDIFKKIKKTPILERTNSELFFRCGPFCMFDDNKFKLWYVAGGSWIKIEKKDMPIYTINYLESLDGIKWGDKGKVCIKIENNIEHGFGRPYVIKSDNIYKMFYSIRKKHLGYRLGYAESYDGIYWERKDHEIGIDVSENGWDSKSICYSSVINFQNKVYMFYNGNDFGKTGVGYAELY